MSLFLASLLIVLGAVLIALSSIITENTTDLPVSSDVARANQGIYTMAIVFLSVGVTIAAFGVDVNVSQNVTLGFIILLGIALLVLAAIIVNKTSGKAKDAAVGVLVTGIVFVVSGIGIVSYLNKDSIAKSVLPAKFRYY
jgi:cytochrome bd-type quinol oxidase subunit 2